MKEIVFSDVDGTLLNSKLQIMPETLKAIKILQSKDIPFVIVSARSPSGIYPSICEPEKIDFLENSLKKKYPDYTICKSDAFLLEITESNINKGSAVKIQKHHFN